MKILGISGSPRPGGNTDTLLLEALRGAEQQGAATMFIALRDLVISPCSGHADCPSREACHHTDDFPALSCRFLSADAVIMATPVYYWNMSAQMKAFVDRNYHNYTHDRYMLARAAGIIIVAASEGYEETEQAMRRFLLSSGQYRGATSSVVVLRAQAGYRDQAKHKPDLLKAATEFGVDIARRAAAPPAKVSAGPPAQASQSI
jgi:multimeric flavodoxin WrbA